MKIASHIFLDLSRLLSRSGRDVATGIDRVEFSYARHLLKFAPHRVDFVATDLSSRIGPLSRASASLLIQEIDSQWRAGRAASVSLRPTQRRALLLHAQMFWNRLCHTSTLFMPNGTVSIYLLVSHHHLDRPSAIQALKNQSKALFVCMIHDIVPIEWPEYARPGHDRRHKIRMETAASLSDGIIANSTATAAALQPFLDRAGRSVPICVAPLGVDLESVSKPREVSSSTPYFVCISTIEPRKNHLMLLAVWRQLALDLGTGAPRLILVGQRGWEYENIADLLERSPPIRRTVEEHNNMSDGELAPLLAGARALLLPSFVEGYGLPVAEALAAGTPVICSDIAALREVGGSVPDYLDPLDGLGWKTAILQYSEVNSVRRKAQMSRFSEWRPPTWERHFEIVDAFLGTLAARVQ